MFLLVLYKYWWILQLRSIFSLPFAGFILNQFSDLHRYLCKQAKNGTELELKIQPTLLQKLHTFTTTFSLSLTVPIWKEKSTTTLQASLQPSVGPVVESLSTHLKKATALVGGTTYPLASLNQTPISSLGAGQQHQVTLFTPNGGNISIDMPNKGKGPAVVGNVDINRNIVGVAVSANGSVEEALDKLTSDVSASFLHLQLIIIIILF